MGGYCPLWWLRFFTPVRTDDPIIRKLWTISTKNSVAYFVELRNGASSYIFQTEMGIEKANYCCHWRNHVWSCTPNLKLQTGDAILCDLSLAVNSKAWRGPLEWICPVNKFHA